MADKQNSDAGATTLSEKIAADDILSKGWSILKREEIKIKWMGAPCWVFWFFTKDDKVISGEGQTDEEALDQIRAAISGEEG